jgi:RimJ/RimL family protein N-acetyltransferase
MPLAFAALDETNARAILNWRYDPPYDVYDEGTDDSEKTLQTFLDPRNAYYAITDDREGLVAYCCFGPDAQVPGGDYGAAALDIGLGVRPDLTGQGHGHCYVDTVLGFGRRTFAPSAFRVTIAAFNQRALTVWKRAGFRPVQAFQRTGDGLAFVMLAREP